MELFIRGEIFTPFPQNQAVTLCSFPQAGPEGPAKFPSIESLDTHEELSHCFAANSRDLERVHLWVAWHVQAMNSHQGLVSIDHNGLCSQSQLRVWCEGTLGLWPLFGSDPIKLCAGAH